jgi:hypothetical protein
LKEARRDFALPPLSRLVYRLLLQSPVRFLVQLPPP